MTTITETSSVWFTEDAADARTNNWFLVSGQKIPAIIVLYLCCIYIVLPIYMKNRKAYNLKHVVMIYNIFQIIACAWLSYKTAVSGWTTHYTFGCQPVDYSDENMSMQMATCTWCYMIIKVVDLIETGFFVLRKKMSQVSLLHVHHHIAVLVTAWLICLYCPGGMITFIIPLNSFIHVLMYSYYLLASFGPEMQKRLITIKSKLTTLQIVHLIVVLIHSMQAFSPSCRLSPEAKLVYVFGVISIIINVSFFINFYIKSFIMKKKHI